MKNNISVDLLGLGDLRLFKAKPFERFNYTIETFIRIASMKKCTSMEEAVKAKSDSVKDETSRGEKIVNIRPARFARDGFCKSLAGVEHCLHKSLAHFAPDAKDRLRLWSSKYRFLRMIMLSRNHFREKKFPMWRKESSLMVHFV